jgi:hypothetical protein
MKCAIHEVVLSFGLKLDTETQKFLLKKGSVVGLRHYATTRKVADSIPYEVIGFFQII